MIGLSTHMADAGVSDTVAGWFGIPTLQDALGMIAMYIVNLILSLASWFVVITGFLLNVSIVITMHIKDFVNSTPAIYDIWRTIRDISGLFIIFALLYAAIELILGITKPNFKDLIKNIVIAGILINFSFFMTSVLIDASNIVSLAIYNSIVPASEAPASSNPAANTTIGIITSSAYDNSKGISNILMNSLKIQQNFDPKNFSLSGPADKNTPILPIKVILTGITGVVIMFTVGMSFLFASLAFIIRLVILLGLLAFSPLWFAAAVVPQISSYAKSWWDYLKGQLIFMPAYLLLMYAALSIINKTSVFTTSGSNGLWQGSNASAFVPTEYIAFIINAAFIIIMLNLPLLAAIKLGAGVKFLDKFGASIKASNIWKNVGSQFGSRTVGRAAYALNESRAVKSFVGVSPTIGGLASKGLTKVSSAGFGQKKGGYEDRLKAKKVGEEKMYKSLGSIDRSRYATEKDFQKAQEAVRGYQKDYRTNLPWKGRVGGVIGFMVDNRANRQTALGLNDEANLETNKNRRNEIKVRMDELDRISNPKNPGFRLLNDTEVQELRRLRSEDVELEASIKRGSGSKKKKDISSFAKTILEEGKGDTEEKPKPEEKPKTT